MLPSFRQLPTAAATAILVALTGCVSTPTNTSSTASPTPTATTAATSGHSMNHGGKPGININTAILSELDKLEAKLGIPALSNKIQASRPYGKTEELVSKNVINQAQFDQIKDMVTIEDVVLTGEAKDVDYMTKLGLMKGHLLVAKELLDAGKPDQAEPHIGHPVEEIYADVEDQLNERKVPEFKTTLIKLQDLIKAGAKDPAEVNAEFNTSMQAVDGAIAALPEAQRQDPKFVLQVINGLLDTANSEYGAAVANGKISAVIEYQDSRGFVMYAETLYQNIAAQVAKTNPDIDKAIVANMTELKANWPTAIAPPAPVKTTEQVAVLIKAIENDSQKVLKPAS
ncbi:MULTISPECIES: helix-hairpin-helix domain-containing protein [Microcoleaceae]|uniref:helix-hairpin-helix domain-containing protein n=1 Tax=Microcoleaceae TaxID=1892252 RepID=UPI0018816E6F|nr:helix-hairpin-helix domain-containing protein [Tychonema sp. LEGE 06208]MBE9163422.1 helix-hairpin-helix domain-containing protein [Tychonema sp. LEGE 06208]